MNPTDYTYSVLHILFDCLDVWSEWVVFYLGHILDPFLYIWYRTVRTQNIWAYSPCDLTLRIVKISNMQQLFSTTQVFTIL